MKLDKIEREMQKTREKITEYQNRLKELDAQRTEIENLQIIQAVRSMRLSKDELAAFVRGDLYGQQPAPMPAPTMARGYQPDIDEQEDNEDE